MTGFPHSIALVALALAGLGTSLAEADSGTEVHTALVAFEACQPLATGAVLAGSAGGLVLVGANGVQQAVFTALDGLPGTKVLAIEPAGTRFWVGSDRGAALVQFSESGGTISMAVIDSFASAPVRDFLVDGETLWVATWGQGLLQYRKGHLRSHHKGESMAARRVTSVAKHGGALWWTSAGAGLWKQQEGRVEQAAQVASDAILWSLDAGEKDLWISGEDGVVSLAGKGARNLYSSRGSASVAGKRLVASFGRGLRSLKGVPARQGPEDSFARSIKSAHGSTCMGSQEALWIRKTTGTWKKAVLRTILPGNDIAAFASNGSRTFAGTFDKGVAQWKDGQFVPISAKHDRNVNALAIDKVDGALWIATSSELVRVHKGQSSRFTKAQGLPSRHTFSLFALKEGGVLVGTARGAAVVQNGFVNKVGGKAGLVTGNVWAVAQTKDGAHWLGTTRGLFQIAKGKVSRYRVVSGELKDDWVMALAPADDGIFVGTYKAGVVRLRTGPQGVVATQLGEGWINPGGLHWDGKILRAATMYGAFVGDGISSAWDRSTRGLTRDTTAFVPNIAGGEWIVTRSGLSLQRSGR